VQVDTYARRGEAVHRNAESILMKDV